MSLEAVEGFLKDLKLEMSNCIIIKENLCLTLCDCWSFTLRSSERSTFDAFLSIASLFELIRSTCNQCTATELEQFGSVSSAENVNNEA